MRKAIYITLGDVRHKVFNLMLIKLLPVMLTYSSVDLPLDEYQADLLKTGILSEF